MSWFKVDDALFEHTKFLGLSYAAAGLWLRGGLLATKQRTNGFIEAKVARAQRWPKKLIGELLDARLWRAVQGGYEIHDFLDYQPDATGRLPRERGHTPLSETRAEAGRRGAERRWHNKHGNLPSDDDKPHSKLPSESTGGDGKSDGKTDGKPMANLPSPDLPISRKTVVPERDTRRAREEGLQPVAPIFRNMFDHLKGSS